MKVHWYVRGWRDGFYDGRLGQYDGGLGCEQPAEYVAGYEAGFSALSHLARLISASGAGTPRLDVESRAAIAPSYMRS